MPMTWTGIGGTGRGLALAAALGLTGCAGALDPGAAGGSQSCVEPGQPVQATLLSILRSGTVQADPFAATPSPPRLAGLVRPEQVAVMGPDVYIADSALGEVLRTDRNGTSYATAARLPATRIGGLAVDRMGTLTVALPAESTLLQLDRQGGAPRRLGDASAVSSPVDVVTDGDDQIFTADGLGARVVRFNRIGQTQVMIGERGDRANPFTTVTALALGPEGLYVLDGTTRQVQVMPAGGAARTVSLGSEARLPVALAVDRWGRIYVADRGRRGLTLLQTAAPQLGDLGGVPPLQNVSDVFVDESGIVYVADSAAGAVYVLAVPRPCP